MNMIERAKLLCCSFILSSVCLVLFYSLAKTSGNEPFRLWLILSWISTCGFYIDLSPWQLRSKVETIWRTPTCAKTSPAYRTKDTISVLTCLETQRFCDSTSDLSQMTQDVATLFDDCRIETSRQGVNHLVSVDFSASSSCISGFLWTGCPWTRWCGVTIVMQKLHDHGLLEGSARWIVEVVYKLSVVLLPFDGRRGPFAQWQLFAGLHRSSSSKLRFELRCGEWLSKVV